MTEPRPGPLARLVRASSEPVDVASLAAFRVLFGLLLVVAPVRFLANGWIAVQYGTPFHFRYYGLEWLPVPSLPVIHAEYAALALVGLSIALGLLTRPALVAYLLVFAHVRSIDVTNYLNHDYLVILLLGVSATLPLGGAWSLDARLFPGVAASRVPAWNVWLLRFQVALVYVFAAVAKATPDWLLHAQPVGIWLRSRSELAVLGGLFEWPATAFVFSWAGFLYDLTIVGWLSWRRSRPVAYAAVLGFHAMTHALFDIGMFPFIMPVATTLFFAPDWPRAALSRLGFRTSTSIVAAPGFRPVPLLALAWVVLQVALPLRAFAYPGHVLWEEEGMRWSWRVMCREKSGAVTFRAKTPSGRVLEVDPLSYVNPRQLREMSTQPDLILQLAHHVAHDLDARGLGPVQVFADTAVSLNARAPAPLIDPNVDLARIEDSLSHATWLLPAPEGPPVRTGLGTHLAATEGGRP